MSATTAKCMITKSKDSPLELGECPRRAVAARDIGIRIVGAGICHSDLHQARGEWETSGLPSIFPMVPGHEITGYATHVGPEAAAEGWKVGDRCGVGVFVDSCRQCHECKDLAEEQYCSGGGMVATYNATYMYEHCGQDFNKPSYGGYSNYIVVDHASVLRVPEALDLKKAAPILCAGVTTYSPLRKFKLKAGEHLGLVGFGGLGHMGLKLAKAMGAKVTVISTSATKEADARALGADGFLVSTDKEAMAAATTTFDFILDTVSSEHDINGLMNLLRHDGRLIMVGLGGQVCVNTFSFVPGRRTLAGSFIAGSREAQETLDFCAEHNIMPEVEVIEASQVNEAYQRMLKKDVKYRFVIDVEASMPAPTM